VRLLISPPLSFLLPPWSSVETYRWGPVKKLSSGGQAEIWLVRDPFLGVEAVQKKLRPTPGHPDPEEEVHRFLREVRTQLRLSQHHDGIMPILGSNFEDTPPWYVMPRATETLRDLVGRNLGGLPTALACQLLMKAADAVAYAHQEGIYHRDLKPENILLIHDRLTVGDFGFCRDTTTNSTTLTEAKTVFGTVYYMAPEQFDNAHEIGPQADVFALGRILYQMLTGRNPYPHQRPELLPSGLDYVVEVSTAEDPRDRFRSVVDFMSNLAEAQSKLMWRAGTPAAPPARRSKAPASHWGSSGPQAARRPAKEQGTLFDLAEYEPRDRAMVESSPGSGCR